MNERRAYPSDLTNEQWLHIRLLLPKTSGKGRRRSAERERELFNAILYILHTGCQWRALPHDFPAWESVYGYFNSLCEVAIWEDINRILRQGVRQVAGREPEPSVVIVDSQSVKTAEKKAIVAALMAASE